MTSNGQLSGFIVILSSSQAFSKICSLPLLKAVSSHGFYFIVFLSHSSPLFCLLYRLQFLSSTLKISNPTAQSLVCLSSLSILGLGDQIQVPWLSKVSVIWPLQSYIPGSNISLYSKLEYSTTCSVSPKWISNQHLKVTPHTESESNWTSSPIMHHSKWHFNHSDVQA